MQDSLDLLGIWWDPAYPQNKVPGRMIWGPVEGGALHLVGSLDPGYLEDDWYPDQELRPQIPEIHGEADDGVRYTLVSAIHNRLRPAGLLEQPYESFTFSLMLGGPDWVSNAMSDSFLGLSIGIKYLDTWIDKTGLTLTHNNRSDFRDKTINSQHLDDTNFTADGIAIKLRQTVQTERNQSSIRFREVWFLDLAPERANSIADLLKSASYLQDLVSLAADDYAEFTDASVIYPTEIPLPNGEVKCEPSRYKLYFQPRNTSTKTKQLMSAELYFTFADIGGAAGLANWFTVAKEYALVLDRAMEPFYNKHLSLEDQQLSSCVSLEMFYKVLHKVKKGKGPNYECMVTGVFKFIGDDLASEIVPTYRAEWATETRRIRNDLAHSRDLPPPRDRVKWLWVLWQQAFWVTIIAIMKEAKFAEPVLQKIMKHRKIVWLASEYRATAKAMLDTKPTDPSPQGREVHDCD